MPADAMAYDARATVTATVSRVKRYVVTMDARDLVRLW